MNDKPTCKTCGWASFPTPTYSKNSSQPQAMGMCKLWLHIHPHMWLDQSQEGHPSDMLRALNMTCDHHLDADRATPEDLERVKAKMPKMWHPHESGGWVEVGAASPIGFWDDGLREVAGLYEPSNNARHWQPIERQRIACEHCAFERSGMCGLSLDNPSTREALQPEDHACPGGCVHGQLKQAELGHPNNMPPHRWWI